MTQNRNFSPWVFEAVFLQNNLIFTKPGATTSQYSLLKKGLIGLLSSFFLASLIDSLSFLSTSFEKLEFLI